MKKEKQRYSVSYRQKRQMRQRPVQIAALKRKLFLCRGIGESPKKSA